MITCCSTLGPMIACGVKIGDQDHPVMVWILTETIMNTGVRYNGIYLSYLFKVMGLFKGWQLK